MPVRLLLRLRWRCGRWRGCRGRSRGRARQQIPDYDQRKDNCCSDDEQPVCVHRVHLLFSCRSTLAPLGALGQAKPLGRRSTSHGGSPPLPFAVPQEIPPVNFSGKGRRVAWDGLIKAFSGAASPEKRSPRPIFGFDWGPSRRRRFFLGCSWPGLI